MTAALSASGQHPALSTVSQLSGWLATYRDNLGHRLQHRWWIHYSRHVDCSQKAGLSRAVLSRALRSKLDSNSRVLPSISDVCTEQSPYTGAEKHLSSLDCKTQSWQVDKLISKQYIRIQSNLKSYPLKGGGGGECKCLLGWTGRIKGSCMAGWGLWPAWGRMFYPQTAAAFSAAATAAKRDCGNVALLLPDLFNFSREAGNLDFHPRPSDFATFENTNTKKKKKKIQIQQTHFWNGLVTHLKPNWLIALLSATLDLV